jgi:quercetin dioxygenase-like cupin family protein
MVPRLLKAAGYVLALVLAFSLGTAVGQQSRPKDNKGLTVEKMVTRDLGGEIEGMQGWQLRLRVLNLAPGGVIGDHSHKDRPAVVYVLQGTLTDHPDGGAMKEHPQGAAWSEGKGTTHWAENKGQTSVVLITGDILKP